MFFMFIYKLFPLGDAGYKLSLILSSLIPPLMAVLVSIIQPEDDSPSHDKSETTAQN